MALPNFVSGIDNPYFALVPGQTYVFESADGSSSNNIAVSNKTINIMGVTCVVVVDTAHEDGEVVEIAKDYYAQDEFGNVWYFGEDVKNFVDGKLVDTHGSWRAGVDGALPGYIMKAAPVVNEEYDQEIAPGVAEDHAKVLSLNVNIDAIPYGDFAAALRIKETTPLEPLAHESKYYVAGVGPVLVVNENDPANDQEFLVKVIVDGTNKNDTLTGKVGTDELNGFNGSDTMDGGAGSDTLDGGKGNDDVTVGTGDHADGGAGEDVLRLTDNAGFGSVDGGDQKNDSLGKAGGDVLKFNGHLDLTDAGVSERIIDIETLSMKDGLGNDKVTLAGEDIFDFDGGDFDPKGREFDAGLAVRVDGDSGDVLELDGGNWSLIAPSNAPIGYDVYTCDVGVLGVAYVLVQEVVTVDLI